MDANANPERDPFLDLVEAEDPAPLLHRLREEDPVHFVESLARWGRGMKTTCASEVCSTGR